MIELPIKKINDWINGIRPVVSTMDKLIISCGKKNCYFSTESASAMSQLKLDIKSDVAFTLIVDPLAFSSLAKAKNCKIEFDADGKRVKYRADNMEGYFTGRVGEYQVIDFLDKKGSATIADKDKNVLNDMISNINLKPVFSTEKLSVLCKSDENGLVMCVADNFHACYSIKKKFGPKLSFAAPIQNIGAAIKFITKYPDYMITEVNNVIYFWNKDIVLGINSVGDLDQLPMYLKYKKMWDKNYQTEVLLEVNELKDALNAGKNVLKNDGDPVAFFVDKKGVTMQCSGLNGQVNVELKPIEWNKVDGDIRVESLNFRDIMTKIRGKVRLRFHDQKACSVADDSTTNTEYFCLAISENKKAKKRTGGKKSE